LYEGGFHDHDDREHFVVLPDRPTLCHFSSAWRSPFARYLGLPEVATRPPPFRSVPERLGLTEEAFEANVRAEIDDVLLEFEEERRRAREGDGVSSTPTPPPPPLSVMTTEDGLRFFRNRGFPTTGPLLGVYRWAADLGCSCFDYESDVNWDDLSFLNAYH
jgi:hypothetical protein